MNRRGGDSCVHEHDACIVAGQVREGEPVPKVAPRGYDFAESVRGKLDERVSAGPNEVLLGLRRSRFALLQRIGDFGGRGAQEAERRDHHSQPLFNLRIAQHAELARGHGGDRLPSELLLETLAFENDRRQVSEPSNLERLRRNLQIDPGGRLNRDELAFGSEEEQKARRRVLVPRHPDELPATGEMDADDLGARRERGLAVVGETDVPLLGSREDGAETREEAGVGIPTVLQFDLDALVRGRAGLDRQAL